MKRVVGISGNDGSLRLIDQFNKLPAQLSHSWWAWILVTSYAQLLPGKKRHLCWDPSSKYYSSIWTPHIDTFFSFPLKIGHNHIWITNKPIHFHLYDTVYASCNVDGWTFSGFAKCALLRSYAESNLHKSETFVALALQTMWDHHDAGTKATSALDELKLPEWTV